MQSKTSYKTSVYVNIIVQSGINDLRDSSVDNVKSKVALAIEIAKQYNPRSKIFITTLLPDRNYPETTDETNQVNSAQANSMGCKVINTAETFKADRNLYRDGKNSHVDKRCTRD